MGTAGGAQPLIMASKIFIHVMLCPQLSHSGAIVVCIHPYGCMKSTMISASLTDIEPHVHIHVDILCICQVELHYYTHARMDRKYRTEICHINIYRNYPYMYIVHVAYAPSSTCLH